MSPKLMPGTTVTPVDKALIPAKGGVMSRVRQAVRYLISGDPSAVWMSPGQPIAPMAQQVQGRTYDFPVGYNLIQRPRADNAVGFLQLRALADSCDLVRMAIETRKDQIKSLEWAVVLKEGESDDDPRCNQLEKFFQRPDRFHPWQIWLGMVVEDLLVIDAPAIFPRRTNGGDIFSFNVMDGALFKPLIDENGLRPMAPDPAYQQWIKGVPAADYSTAELIYLPRNVRSNQPYGFSPVEQIITTINIAVRRSLTQLEYFTAGTVPPVILSCPPEWTVDQVQQFQKYMDAMWTGDLAQKHQVRAAPGGAKPTMIKESPLKDEFDEWLARVVCYAFSLPPTAFTKQTNRATAVQAQEAATDEGLAPLMQWVKCLMDMIIVDFFGFDDLEFIWQQRDEMDPSAQATIDDVCLRNGSTTIDEVRASRGQDPLPDKLGSRPLIYTATGVVTLEDSLTEEPPNGTPTSQSQTEKNPASAQGGEVGAGTQAGASAQSAQGSQVSEKALIEKKKSRAEADRIAANSKKLAKAIAPKLKATAKSVASQVGKYLKKAQPSDDRLEEIIAGLALFDYTSWRSDYSEVVEPAVEEAFTEAMSEVGVEIDDTFGLARTRAAQWADERAAELLGSDGDGGELADATRLMIRGLISDALDGGWTNDELSQELQDSYAFSEDRADTISDTEFRAAISGGKLEGYRASGVVTGKVWLLSGDGDVCDECQENADEGVIDLDDIFPSGDDAPPGHPNCRCSISPVTDDEEED